MLEDDDQRRTHQEQHGQFFGNRDHVPRYQVLAVRLTAVQVPLQQFVHGVKKQVEEDDNQNNKQDSREHLHEFFMQRQRTDRQIKPQHDQKT